MNRDVGQEEEEGDVRCEEEERDVRHECVVNHARRTEERAHAGLSPNLLSSEF